jgi:hypothetical protein
MVKNDPLWRKYERAIEMLLSTMDPNAKVAHNAMVTGRLSGVSRQVDVLARGTVVGLEISVASECKRYTRTVGIGIVDQFIGKLLDLAAERGILYSYSGFSQAALHRAFGSSNPSVLLVTLENPEDVAAGAYAPDYSTTGPVDSLWADELDTEDYLHFLQTGKWWKWANE